MKNSGAFKKGAKPWNKGKSGYTCRHQRIYEKLPEVLELISKGKSRNQIHKLVNLNPKTITKLLIKEGYTKEEKKMVENGMIRWRRTVANTVTTPEKFIQMLELSEQGLGIDLIGKKLNVDGTTVRHQLIKHLGKEEYSKRHSKKKYTHYWSGRYFKNKRGDRLQSSLEEKVVDYLFKLGIEYTTHTCLKLPEGKFYPDVKLEKTGQYIEIFGMSDLNFYIKKMNIKKKTYQKNNVNFLSIEKHHFQGDEYKTLINNFI